MARNLETAWKLLEFLKISFGITKLQDPRLARAQKGFLVFLLFCVVTVNLNLFFSLWTSTQLSWKIYYGIILIAMLAYSLVMVYFVMSIETYEERLQWCESLHSRDFGRLEAMAKCKRDSSKCFLLFGAVVPGASVVAYFTQAFILSLYKGYIFNPMMFLSPFETGSGQMLIIFAQLVNGIFLLLSTGATLSLMVGINLHFSALLEIKMALLRSITPEISPKQFEEKIKEVVEIHCELIEQQFFFRQFYSNLMLLIEFIAFLLLLIAWIIVFFMRGLIILAFLCAVYVYIYIIPCIITERLSDSFEDFRDTIYDMEWYEMSPKQRKVILQIMVMADRKNLLRCGPFYVVNFEAFTNLLKRVYDYGLIINALVDPRSFLI